MPETIITASTSITPVTNSKGQPLLYAFSLHPLHHSIPKPDSIWGTYIFPLPL